eukprot:5784774-Amphidinium_carterae.1
MLVVATSCDWRVSAAAVIPLITSSLKFLQSQASNDKPLNRVVLCHQFYCLPHKVAASTRTYPTPLAEDARGQLHPMQ